MDSEPEDPGEAELLSLYGIVKVPAYRYRIGGFSYSSLGDAIAQARRGGGAADPGGDGA